MPECFTHSPKTVKILKNIVEKNSPIKNLHCTHRMQFWQTQRKIFAERSKKLCPKSKIKETIPRICFQKTVLPKVSPGHLKTVLTTQQDFYRQKCEKFSSKSQKQRKILKILWKRNLFLQTCPLDTNKTVFTTMSKKFYKIPNIFPQNPLVGVNFLEENDNVMPEGPPNECREQFFKSTGTASDRNSQSFSSKLQKFLKVNIFFRKQLSSKSLLVK